LVTPTLFIQLFLCYFFNHISFIGNLLITKSLPKQLKKRAAAQEGYTYIAVTSSNERNRSLDPSINDNKHAGYSKNMEKWLIPLGLLIGILSSFLGIGGGWLLVPILIYVFRVPTHYATATSIFSLCLYSSVGVLLQIFNGNIDWMAVTYGGLGVIAGSQIGVLLSQKIPGKVIIQMLSVLLIIIGFRMYFN
jgi:uncharacterized protein